MTPLLSLQGASKRYGGVQANAGIDLNVDSGSIHAILGENGAGKSTLMKLIYGVETPDEGEILWKGAPVRLASPADARRLGIGMVFQHFSLFETLTVAENIALAMGAEAGTPKQPYEEATVLFEVGALRNNVAELFALPDGYAAFVMPRSGLAARNGITVVNAPGTVDAGYRGEIRVTLLNTDATESFSIRPGDRIAQLVIAPGAAALV